MYGYNNQCLGISSNIHPDGQHFKSALLSTNTHHFLFGSGQPVQYLHRAAPQTADTQQSSPGLDKILAWFMASSDLLPYRTVTSNGPRTAHGQRHHERYEAFVEPEPPNFIKLSGNSWARKPKDLTTGACFSALSHPLRINDKHSSFICQNKGTMALTSIERDTKVV